MGVCTHVCVGEGAERRRRVLTEPRENLLEAARRVQVQLPRGAERDERHIAAAQDRELHRLLECADAALCKGALQSRVQEGTQKTDETLERCRGMSGREGLTCLVRSSEMREMLIL